MSRYNEVYQCTWDSKDFKSLSKPEPNAQTLWLFLLTGKIRTPLPGIYNVGLGALEDFLKWSRKSLTKCFQELSRNDMVKVDLDNNVIYLPNWDKWNKPQNPNVLKGWLTLLDNIPNCEYKYLYYQQLKSLVEPLKKPFHEVLGESFPTPKPVPVPKPVPKPDRETPQAVSFPSFFDNDSFKKTFDDFKDMRKFIKSKMTLNAENLIIKELVKLSDSNSELAIKILEQSIMSSYKGVFPLKNMAKSKSDVKVGTKYAHIPIDEIA